MIKHTKENEFQKELNVEGVILVNFFATWCPPCQLLGKELEEIEKKNPELSILKVNVDECQKLGMIYQVVAVPTMIIVKDKKIVKRLEGFMKANELLAEIAKVGK